MVQNYLSYQMLCAVSLHKHFEMRYACFLNGMEWRNNGKWNRDKDAYPKQKCKIYFKSKGVDLLLMY